MHLRIRLTVITFFVAITFIATMSAGCVPAINVENAPPANSENMLADHVEVTVDASETDPDPKKEAATPEIPPPDGQSLLEKHCAQCHPVQSLIKPRKSRLEWDMALAQMKGMGVRLSNEEKDVLLDFLSVPEEP